MVAKISDETQLLVDELVSSSGHVHGLWGYALLALLVQDKKARITGERQSDEGKQLEFETLRGQRLWLTRPEMTLAAEKRLLKAIRQGLGLNMGAAPIGQESANPIPPVSRSPLDAFA